MPRLPGSEAGVGKAGSTATISPVGEMARLRRNRLFELTRAFDGVLDWAGDM